MPDSPAIADTRSHLPNSDLLLTEHQESIESDFPQPTAAPGDRVRKAMFGIMAVGMLYPFVVHIMLFLLSPVIGFMVVNDQAQAILLLGFLVLFMLFFGGPFLAMVTLMSIGATSFIVRTVSKHLPWPYIAGAAGGLTGFVFTCWVFAIESFTFGQSIAAIALGPAFATVLGQVGGTWKTVAFEFELDQNPADESILRFDIRQLMIATAWVAGILTLLKLTNALGPSSAGIVAGWFVFQAITLVNVVQLVKKVQCYA